MGGASPQFLICDADALIQLLLTKETRLLTALRGYGVSAVIPPEVDIELRSGRKFASRIARDLNKAIGNGALQILDPGSLANAVDSGPAGAALAAQIISRAKRYARIVDFGEAHTHAAAVELKVPALSHDKRALDALIAAGEPVPNTVLRFFDLLAFGVQTKAIAVADADSARSLLLSEGEWIPAAFKNRSFASGVASFGPRVIDGKLSPLCALAPVSTPYSTPVLL